MADTGFPRGGGTNSPRGAPTDDFIKISQKLHETERIWTPGGGGGARPKFYYVDPPLQHSFNCEDLTCGHYIFMMDVGSIHILLPHLTFLSLNVRPQSYGRRKLSAEKKLNNRKTVSILRLIKHLNKIVEGQNSLYLFFDHDAFYFEKSNFNYWL